MVQLVCSVYCWRPNCAAGFVWGHVKIRFFFLCMMVLEMWKSGLHWARDSSVLIVNTVLLPLVQSVE